jgi:hypothetical protein
MSRSRGLFEQHDSETSIDDGVHAPGPERPGAAYTGLHGTEMMSFPPADSRARGASDSLADPEISLPE